MCRAIELSLVCRARSLSDATLIRRYEHHAFLVLLTERLKAEPGAVMEEVVGHLGLRPYVFSNLHARYNAADCGYGWNEGCKKGAAGGGDSGGGGGDGAAAAAKTKPPESPAVAAAMAKLRAFYLQHTMPGLRKLLPRHDFSSWRSAAAATE